MSRYFCERSNILAVETCVARYKSRAAAFYIVLWCFSLDVCDEKPTNFKEKTQKNILLHAFLVKLNNYQIKMRLTTT
jgi:hypothetical protein